MDTKVKICLCLLLVIVLIPVVLFVIPGYLAPSRAPGNAPSFPPVNNSTLYIVVDPIADRRIGDVFTVRGITNLPAGTELHFEATPTLFPVQMMTGEGRFSGVLGTITVNASGGGRNAWSTELNTSGFEVNKYIMRVQTSDGEVYGTAYFQVS